MPANFSPWIHQLQRKRPIIPIAGDAETQVAIVGGGIAGISTAYFILKNTTQSVLLLEGDKVAHGATGHNAGQVVSYFEQQISNLAKEYGVGLVCDAQNAIDGAWDLLKQIYTDANLRTPLSEFVGYAGCQDLDEIIVHLENIILCKKAKIVVEPLFVASDTGIHTQIPKKFKGLYTLAPHAEILDLLETNDKSFVAAVTGRKGCMNSAIFCEELLAFIQNTYPKKFLLFEGSHVSHVYLDHTFARLKVKKHTVIAQKVILCTNGFERFSITNLTGGDIDTKFHHLVRGSVGYMAAYLEEHIRPSTAISYLPQRNGAQKEAYESAPYFYLTRRTYEREQNQKHSLVCLGGPEALMDDTNNYSKEHPYPQEAQKTLDAFLHKTYRYAPKKHIDYHYLWHGLMGYTPNGLRCIGPEPINPILLYNLGCNGVGILPSIYGGKKISQFLNGEKLKKSIFDPLDSR